MDYCAAYLPIAELTYWGTFPVEENSSNNNSFYPSRYWKQVKNEIEKL
jgi:hypothetical protein